nr:unnamed protein product [Callosobruchus analis]
MIDINSISPAEREKYRPRTPQEPELKKPKKEEKDLGHVSTKHSDGEKSDQDLVVDDASEDPASPPNGTASPRENGLDGGGGGKLPKKEHPGPAHSPRSGTSSNASTPSAKKLDGEKPSTPISKPVTPTSGASGASGAAPGGLKPVVKPPALGQYPPYLAMCWAARVASSCSSWQLRRITQQSSTSAEQLP